MKLEEKHLNLVVAALQALAARQISSVDVIEPIIQKLRNSETFMEAERGIVGIALLGAGMELGPASHSLLVQIARQLGVEAELTNAGQSWIHFHRAPNVEVLPVESAHTGRCESLWRPDLECPNAAEFILRVRSNKGFAIMCAVHAKGYLEQYRGNDLDVIAYTEEELHACTEARKQVEAN